MTQVITFGFQACVDSENVNEMLDWKCSELEASKCKKVFVLEALKKRAEQLGTNIGNLQWDEASGDDYFARDAVGNRYWCVMFTEYVACKVSEGEKIYPDEYGNYFSDVKFEEYLKFSDGHTDVYAKAYKTPKGRVIN